MNKFFMNKFIERFGVLALWNKMPWKKSSLLVEMLFDGEASSEDQKRTIATFSPESLSRELDQRAKIRKALKSSFGQSEKPLSEDVSSALTLTSNKQELDKAWALLEKRILAEGGFAAESRSSRSSSLSELLAEHFTISRGGLRAAGGLAFAMSIAVIFTQTKSFYDKGSENSSSMSSEQIAARQTASASDQAGISELDKRHLNDPALKLESFFASRRVLPDSGVARGAGGRVDSFHFVSDNKSPDNSDDGESQLYRLPTPNGLVEFSRYGRSHFNDSRTAPKSNWESNWESQLISRERISEELKSQYPE